MSQSSATIVGRPSDGLFANHTNMIRFSDASDPNLKKIVDVLRSMLQSLKDTKEKGRDLNKTDIL